MFLRERADGLYTPATYLVSRAVLRTLELLAAWAGTISRGFI